MNKTPISYLQELMVAKNLAMPRYTDFMSDKSGFSFKCVVNCGDIEGVGYGSTKKAAKHESAQDALKKMGFSLNTGPLKVSESPESGPNNDVANSFNSPNGNYIGTLNEMAAQMGKPAPTFEDEIAAQGFKISCSFSGIVASGSGSAKKIAKQLAAQNVLKEVNARGLLHFMAGKNVPVPSEGDMIKQAVRDVKRLQEKFKQLFEHSESDDKSSSEISYPTLKSLKEELGDSCEINVFPNKEPSNSCIIRLRLENAVTLLGVGFTVKEATENLLQTILQTNKLIVANV